MRINNLRYFSCWQEPRPEKYHCNGKMGPRLSMGQAALQPTASKHDDGKVAGAEAASKMFQTSAANSSLAVVAAAPAIARTAPEPESPLMTGKPICRVELGVSREWQCGVR